MVTDSARSVISPGTSAIRACAWTRCSGKHPVDRLPNIAVERGRPHCSRVAAAAESSSSDRPEMGYAALMRFAPDELALLADCRGDRDRDRATGRSAPPNDHLGRRRWRRRVHPFGQRRRGALVSRGGRRPVGHGPRRRAGAACSGGTGHRPGFDPPDERRARTEIRHDSGRRCERCSSRTSWRPRCGSSPPDDRRPARTRRLEPTTDVLR